MKTLSLALFLIAPTAFAQKIHRVLCGNSAGHHPATKASADLTDAIERLQRSHKIYSVSAPSVAKADYSAEVCVTIEIETR